ncbi:MAG TPA: hypothetical protein VGJ75_08830 [Dongiaceae bacterium]|jgi:hypothetical protein
MGRSILEISFFASITLRWISKPLKVKNISEIAFGGFFSRPISG